jgi:LysM repeat protein
MAYMIKKDEKISDIVDVLDIPYSVIQRFNPFVESMDGVYEGKSLTLPRQYVVQPNETYLSISKRFSVNLLYMKELNPYIDGPNSVIYPGQTIYLPAKEYH